MKKTRSKAQLLLDNKGEGAMADSKAAASVRKQSSKLR
jgi:hypothetical protein